VIYFHDGSQLAIPRVLGKAVWRPVEGVLAASKDKAHIQGRTAAILRPGPFTEIEVGATHFTQKPCDICNARERRGDCPKKLEMERILPDRKDISMGVQASHMEDRRSSIGYVNRYCESLPGTVDSELPSYSQFARCRRLRSVRSRETLRSIPCLIGNLESFGRFFATDHGQKLCFFGHREKIGRLANSVKILVARTGSKRAGRYGPDVSGGLFHLSPACAEPDSWVSARETA
jgi:hypothetical protein